MQSDDTGARRSSGFDTSSVSFALRGGGTATVSHTSITLPTGVIPLTDVAWAGLVVDPSVPVPPGAWPFPAVGVTLRSGDSFTITPADPPEAWRLLDTLYRERPDLATPPPPPPMNGPYDPSGSSRGAGTPGTVGLAYTAGAPSSSDTVLAGLSHLSIFFAPLLFPLIVWLVTRRTSPYVARQSKQALFFHLVYSVVAALLALVAVFGTFGGFIFSLSSNPYGPVNPAPFIAFLIAYGVVILLALVEIGFSIYGAVQAFQGRPFSYPFLGRL